MENYCILIVEDQDSVRNTLIKKIKIAARELGYKNKILESISPTDAASQIVNNRVDILFLDYHFNCGEKAEKLMDFLIKLDIYIYIILVSGYKENPVEKSGNSSFKYDDYIYKGKDDSALTEGSIKKAYRQATEYLNKKPLPNPIEVNKKVYDDTDDQQYRKKLEVLITFCETSLKYLIYILLSDIRAQNQGDTNLIIPNFELKEYYEFGFLRNLLINLFKQTKKNSCCFVPEIVDLLETPFSNKDKPLGFLHKVIDKRNPLSHKYSDYTDFERQEILKQLSPSFNEFKNLFRLFLHYPLVYLEGITDNYKYKGRLLMGDETRGRESYFENKIFENIAINQDYLLMKKVYLKTPNADFLPLFPFVIFQICKDCKREMVFLMNGVSESNKTIQYKCMSNHDHSDSDSINYQKLKDFVETGLWPVLPLN